MTNRIRKVSKFAFYAVLLGLTSIVSAVLGGKKSATESKSLVKDLVAPTAHADIPAGADNSDTGQSGSTACNDVGTDTDVGSDAGCD